MKMKAYASYDIWTKDQSPRYQKHINILRKICWGVQPSFLRPFGTISQLKAIGEIARPLKRGESQGHRTPPPE